LALTSGDEPLVFTVKVKKYSKPLEYFLRREVGFWPKSETKDLYN